MRNIAKEQPHEKWGESCSSRFLETLKGAQTVAILSTNDAGVAVEAARILTDSRIPLEVTFRTGDDKSGPGTAGRFPLPGRGCGCLLRAVALRPIAAGLARARVQVHYLTHDCFFRPGELLDGVARIAHLPGILLQGAMDFVCPPVTAFEVARRWPSARLSMIAAAKHAASHPHLESALVAAADSLRDQLVSLGTVAVVA